VLTQLPVEHFYLYETYQKNPLATVEESKHYNPGDTPDGKHFIKRDLATRCSLTAHKPFKQYLGWINSKEYYYLIFIVGVVATFVASQMLLILLKLLIQIRIRKYL